MPSDPIICPLCDLVFEVEETKHIGDGHRVCLDCYDENGLNDPNALSNVLFDLNDEEPEL